MSDKTSQSVALGWHDDQRMQDDYKLVKDYIGLDKPFDVKTTYTNAFLDKSIKMKRDPGGLNTYDVILLGAGHNSLVLQAYLGRAGLKTLCLERSATVGGGLVDDRGSALAGLPAQHPLVLPPRDRPDAVVPRSRARAPRREVRRARAQRRTAPEERRRALLVDRLRSHRRIVRAVQRARRGDAAAMARSVRADPREDPRRRKRGALRRHPTERQSAAGANAEGRLLLETSALSPLEFVQREFEHPVVKAGLLFFNGLREVDLRLRGFGHHIPALLASPAKAQMCLGGAARLADALAQRPCARPAARSARRARRARSWWRKAAPSASKPPRASSSRAKRGGVQPEPAADVRRPDGRRPPSSRRRRSASSTTCSRRSSR